MLLVTGALILLTLVILARVRAVRNAATLGWMSERWLAAYRASNP
jgi:hypothetical protein